MSKEENAAKLTEGAMTLVDNVKPTPEAPVEGLGGEVNFGELNVQEIDSVSKTAKLVQEAPKPKQELPSEPVKNKHGTIVSNGSQKIDVDRINNANENYFDMNAKPKRIIDETGSKVGTKRVDR